MGSRLNDIQEEGTHGGDKSSDKLTAIKVIDRHILGYSDLRLAEKLGLGIKLRRTSNTVKS